MKLGKRGVFDQLGALGVGAVVLMLTLVVALLIGAQVQANPQVAADTNASNAATEIQNSTAGISNWVPLVILVAIGALLIFLVRRFG